MSACIRTASVAQVPGLIQLLASGCSCHCPPPTHLVSNDGAVGGDVAKALRAQHEQDGEHAPGGKVVPGHEAHNLAADTLRKCVCVQGLCQ
jgi:hypothetical protein